jgi:hypothetical protein
MRLAFFNFKGEIIWKLGADAPSLFSLPGASDWVLVNPLYYSQLPILHRSGDVPIQVGANQYLLFNAELVFAAVGDKAASPKNDKDDLIRIARSLLLRLRHLSGQAALPVSDSYLMGTGYAEIESLPKLPLDSWTFPSVRFSTQKYMLDTAITAKQINEAIALGDDFAAPTNEALLLDAIVAYRDHDYRKAILYAAISAEVAFGSVIEDAYAHILAARKDDRFRVIELHQAGGVIVPKDPIYERLQNRSDFTVLINELSLYVLGRSLLMEDQVLFASAKRLYSTRNRIVHSGELSENESNSIYSLDEGGAMASLRTAVSLFAWLGLRNDFPLPGMEFVPGPLP